MHEKSYNRFKFILNYPVLFSVLPNNDSADLFHWNNLDITLPDKFRTTDNPFS